jgi:glycosyltransferase involved in cell wall biosynthesis
VWVIGTCVSCLAAARLTGRKVLLSHHYHHFDNATSRLRWSAFYLAFGAGIDAITYPTEFTRNEALKIAPWLQGKTHVVRNGFDVHYTTEERRLADKRAARAELKIPQDALVVGNGGWLIQRKRFDVFLQTAQRVIRQLPDSRFYICGGGPEEPRLRQLASELGIANQVHFVGWVQNMDTYYRAWDVLLFNTDFDALGCTPLEAAAHGCLGVASCVHGGLHEFLQDGQTGFILNRHDPEKLAAGIIRLAREPGLALAMRQRAIQKLEQEFSHQRALDFYEHYFRPAGMNGNSA